MAISLKSSNLPAFLLEAAEQLRKAEASLSPGQNRVSISYGSSNATPRIATITATLPVTRSRVAEDGGTKYLYNDYAPINGGVVLTGTPLAAMAVESLAEALGVAAEELDAAERAKIDSGATLPSGVGTGITISGLEATISASLMYNVTFNDNGQTVLTVVNHVA
ncbi:MAG: hypothetical protein ACPL4I_11145 [Bacteroidota bacterium]|jgi:hypothetical protein